MTCYPSSLIAKLVGPTIRQLVYIGKAAFILHFLVHLNNFYYFTKGTEIDPAEFYVATLSVLPEYRSQGVGSEMLRYARKLAREQGFKRCALHVTAENKDGIRFYERNGYKKSGPAREQAAYFRMVYSV
jgi:ribosomal protein S18 acetylase RimI-like enzyme